MKLIKIHDNIFVKMDKADKSKTEKDKKFEKVMSEFKDGKLKSSDGKIVTDKKQAIAIALSESGQSMQKAKGSFKYYKKEIKGGKPRYYYTKEQYQQAKKEEKQAGKKDGVLSGIMKFFGFKDEKQAQEKISSLYNDNKSQLTGVDKNTFADYTNEYLSNKDKWDKKFQKKTVTTLDKKTGKLDKKKATDKKAVMSQSGKKWNLGLMKKIAGIVGGVQPVKETPNIPPEKGPGYKEEQQPKKDKPSKFDKEFEKKINKDTAIKGLPAIGSEVKIGQKDKKSIWSGDMRGGKSAIVIGHDKLDGEPVVVIALKEKFHSPNFDKNMDYEIVYQSELNKDSIKEIEGQSPDNFETMPDKKPLMSSVEEFKNMEKNIQNYTKKQFVEMGIKAQKEKAIDPDVTNRNEFLMNRVMARANSEEFKEMLENKYADLKNKQEPSSDKSPVMSSEKSDKNKDTLNKFKSLKKEKEDKIKAEKENLNKIKKDSKKTDKEKEDFEKSFGIRIKLLQSQIDKINNSIKRVESQGDKREIMSKNKKMKKANIIKIGDTYYNLNKAKKMPIGTINSKGYKKVAEGKWVKETKDKKPDKPTDKKTDKKDDKSTDKSAQKEDIKTKIKDTLKKVTNILAEALSGRDVVQPTGQAVEQVGENAKKKEKVKKDKKDENKKPDKKENTK